jgi:O-antigen ligase
LFSLVFILRMLIDELLSTGYSLSFSQMFASYLSFGIIPFFVISNLKLSFDNIKFLEKSLLIAAFLYSILAAWFYFKFLGTLGRLSTHTSGEEVLSPLALSYSATLALGFALVSILNKTVKGTMKWLMYITIVASIIPFLLGASRGAILALVVSLLFYGGYIFIYGKTLTKVKIVFFTIILMSILIYTAIIFESSAFTRFLRIFEAMEEGDSSAIRTEIWKQAFNQFLGSPIIGSSFVIKGFESYAHNFIIEVLQTTGIVGFLPFVFIFYKAFKASLYLFAQAPQFSWISIAFIQCIVRFSFSGTLYSAGWLWVITGILFAIYYYVKRQKVLSPV